jgi:hypothetical protein
LKITLHKALAISQWRRRRKSSIFTLLTHTIPVNHNYMFPKVIHGEDLPLGRCPTKKRCSQWKIVPPNTLPREKGALMRYKDIIKKYDIKHPSLRRDPG